MNLVSGAYYSDLKKCLTGTARRQEFLAQNIANISTPGYRRKDFDFRARLLALREDGFSRFGPDDTKKDMKPPAPRTDRKSVV